MMAAQKILTGTWTARWGEWQICVKQGSSGWTVIVWHWPDQTALSSRRVIGKTAGLRDAQTAIDWASSLLKEHGAKVFVNGREQPLSAFLSFTPAPELVP